MQWRTNKPDSHTTKLHIFKEDTDTAIIVKGITICILFKKAACVSNIGTTSFVYLGINL